jgi:predicted transcriptional regulator
MWGMRRAVASSTSEGMYLNLRPFMFRAPLLMQQGASLTRALSLFRQMGLHHILVAPPDPRAIGFITRKVILPPHVNEDANRLHLARLSWFGG